MSTLKEQTVKEIKKILVNEVAPMLAMHGGAVEFVDFDAKSGVVSVRLKGMCKGCSLAELTLKGGIEAILVAKVHGIKSVENVE
jgi:Fe-S cluster biogenesis protein NfuA